MSDVIDKAKAIGHSAIDKTGEMVEIGKHKAKIQSQKSQIEKLERQIGKYVYEQFKENEDEDMFDSEVRDTCRAIDASFDEIALLENKIEKAKE